MKSILYRRNRRAGKSINNGEAGNAYVSKIPIANRKIWRCRSEMRKSKYRRRISAIESPLCYAHSSCARWRRANGNPIARNGISSLCCNQKAVRCCHNSALCHRMARHLEPALLERRRVMPQRRSKSCLFPVLARHCGGVAALSSSKGHHQRQWQNGRKNIMLYMS